MRKKIIVMGIVVMFLLTSISIVSGTLTMKKSLESKSQPTVSSTGGTVWDDYDWTRVYDAGWKRGYWWSNPDDAPNIVPGDYILTRIGTNHQDINEVCDVYWDNPIEGVFFVEFYPVDDLDAAIEWTRDIFNVLTQDGDLLSGTYNNVDISISWDDSLSVTWGVKGLETTISSDGETKSVYGWRDIFGFETSGTLLKAIVELICGINDNPAYHQIYKFEIAGHTVLEIVLDSADNTPEIQITKPENAIYLNGNKLTSFAYPVILVSGITVETWVDSGGVGPVIEKVEFYIDNKLKKTDTSSPYSWDWNGRYFGTHTLKAKVYNSHGKSASDSMDVRCFFLK